MRAIHSAAGPRSVEDLAVEVGDRPSVVRATVVRLADRGYAGEVIAWTLTRSGRRLLADLTTHAHLTALQRRVLAAADAAGGARTVPELAATLRCRCGAVTYAMHQLADYACVRRVDAWQATAAALRDLPELTTRPPLVRRNGVSMPSVVTATYVAVDASVAGGGGS